MKKKRSRHVFSKLSHPLLVLFQQALNNQLPHCVLGVLYKDPSGKMKVFRSGVTLTWVVGLCPYSLIAARLRPEDLMSQTPEHTL